MKTLADISTRELLDAQDRMRHISWTMDEEDEFVFKRLGLGGEYENVSANKAQITEELAKREHVSAKKEGKLLRRLCSKHGITPDEARKQFAAKLANLPS